MGRRVTSGHLSAEPVCQGLGTSLPRTLKRFRRSVFPWRLAGHGVSGERRGRASGDGQAGPEGPGPLASQDGAAGALSPSCTLGPRVLRPAPLAVGAVHSLWQVRPSVAGLLQGHLWPPPLPNPRGVRGKSLRPSLCVPPEANHPCPHLPPWPDNALAPRKRARRPWAGLQGSMLPAEAALLRPTQLGSLSKSDTRLHELHSGPQGGRAQRPVSMDLLRPHWPEMSRALPRLQAATSAFPHRELPQGPPAASPAMGPMATYSNVGLAAFPRVGLAASPVVAEYACVQKLKGTEQGSRKQQGRAKESPAAQVDILYSRVCKPKRRDPGPTTAPLDLEGRGAIPALGGDSAYEALPLRGLGVDSGPLENVYESIQEMGAHACPEPPALAVSISGHKLDTWAPCVHLPQPRERLETPPCPEHSSAHVLSSTVRPTPPPQRTAPTPDLRAAGLCRPGRASCSDGGGLPAPEEARV
nr:lck-interacting transmembrane adapter 1 isoform X2 [Microcebus murinus]